MTTGLLDVLALQGITHPSSNVTSEAIAGFETVDERSTAYISVSSTEFDVDAYLSLVLGTNTKDITAAEAKKLPCVIAGEEITVYCELLASSLSGSRSAALEIEFYQEDGTRVGSTTSIPSTEAATWEQKKNAITVPTGATRVNFYMAVGCDAAESVKLNMAHLKIVRE